LSQQLGIAVGELRGYGKREQTRTDHLRDVVAYCNWCTIGAGVPLRFTPNLQLMQYASIRARR
jgi:hypothetical protein